MRTILLSFLLIVVTLMRMSKMPKASKKIDNSPLSDFDQSNDKVYQIDNLADLMLTHYGLLLDQQPISLNHSLEPLNEFLLDGKLNLSERSSRVSLKNSEIQSGAGFERYCTIHPRHEALPKKMYKLNQPIAEDITLSSQTILSFMENQHKLTAHKKNK